MTDSNADVSTEKKELGILIAEDELITRELILNHMEKYGLCDVAKDGKEALEAFKKAHKKNKPYDLICIDIIMPEMDGLKLLEKIRGYEKKNEIHYLQRANIIIATDIQKYETIEYALKEKCDSYIIKPFTEKKLEKALKKMDWGIRSTFFKNSYMFSH